MTLTCRQYWETLNRQNQLWNLDSVSPRYSLSGCKRFSPPAVQQKQHVIRSHKDHLKSLTWLGKNRLAELSDTLDFIRNLSVLGHCLGALCHSLEALKASGFLQHMQSAPSPVRICVCSALKLTNSSHLISWVILWRRQSRQTRF